MQVLSYTEPSTSPARPAAISVMGTLAIVFGTGGIVAGFIGSMMALMFVTASTMLGNLPTVTGDFAGPKGFYVDDRQIIVRAFHAKQAMTPYQQSQLGFLLSDVGTIIAPAITTSTSGDPAMDYLNNSLIGEAGTMVEDGSGVWFDLPAGKISVTDTDATFTPAKFSSLKPIRRSTLRTMVTPINLSKLSSGEVQMVIDRVQEMAGSSPLNPAQVTALRNELVTNSGKYIGSPADMPALFGQITAVIPSGLVAQNGTVGDVDISFPTTDLTISSTGSVSTVQGSINGNPFPKMAKWPLRLTLAGCVLSLCLAVYLLVVGIVTLRNSFYAPLLLRIYACTKIVVALALAAGGWWSWSEFGQAVSAQGGSAATGMPPNWLSIGTTTAAGTLIISCALPITILVLLRTKAVKAFYSQNA